MTLTRIAWLRTCCLLLSAGALISWLSLWDERIAFVSASAYIGAGLLQLRIVYLDSKRYRAGATEPTTLGTESIDIWLDGPIALSGLVMMIVWKDSKDSGLGAAGALIWVSAIACYYFTGVILENVGGIRLKMTYGGWRVSSGSRQRPRTDEPTQ